MAEIEEVLWNIFTSYSLNGNPRDPSRLNGSGLLKLCRDIMALDPVMTECPLNQAYLDLIYTSEINSPKKVRSSHAQKSDKLDFDQFLSCLVRIAKKCYPGCTTSDEAMQQLLMDNLLPMAARRKPISIASFLKQAPVEALFKHYELALMELFKFYVASSDQNLKGKSMIKATSNIVKTFDDHTRIIEESKTRNSIQNSSVHCIGYTDFMRFANDFGMTTSLGLTSLDLGDVYLTVISMNNFSPSLRKIDFKEFWEALVRCALLAFKDKTKITTEAKIKGLFHYFWRSTQTATQNHMIGYGTLKGGGFNSYRGGLLKGAQLLNDRFLSAWTRDDYPDYLQTDKKGATPGVREGGGVGTGGGGAGKASSIHSSTEPSPRKQLSSSSASFSASMAMSMSSPLNKTPVAASSLMSKLRGGTAAASSSSSSSAANTPSRPYTPGKGSMTARTSSTSSLFGGGGAGEEEEGGLRRENDCDGSDNEHGGEGGHGGSGGGQAEAEEDLHNLLHETIERRENFNVRTSDGDVICVTIRDDDHVGDADGRIAPEDLRRLLSLRPDLAATLYECVLEEGIVPVPETAVVRGRGSSIASIPDGDDENAFKSPASRKGSSRGQGLHISDLNGSDNDSEDGGDEQEDDEGDFGEAKDGEDTNGGVDTELDAMMDGLVEDGDEDETASDAGIN